MPLRYAAGRIINPEDGLPPGGAVAHIDGGARGNPGPAGFGVVVQDAQGKQVAGFGQFLGVQTNNFAEYSGLLAALDYALRHDIRALKVVSDSELMVKQINGQYKVRAAPLQELHARARGLIRQLAWFRMEHVLRAKNREADRLANLAMDEGQRGVRGNVGPRAAAASSPQPAPSASQQGLFAASSPPEVSGVVRNGVVHLEPGARLPEGARVTVRIKD